MGRVRKSRQRRNLKWHGHPARVNSRPGWPCHLPYAEPYTTQEPIRQPLNLLLSRTRATISDNLPTLLKLIVKDWLPVAKGDEYLIYIHGASATIMMCGLARRLAVAPRSRGAFERCDGQPQPRGGHDRGYRAAKLEEQVKRQSAKVKRQSERKNPDPTGLRESPRFARSGAVHRWGAWVRGIRSLLTAICLLPTAYCPTPGPSPRKKEIL